MNNTKRTTSEEFGRICFLVLSLFALIILNAFVFTKLWGWFIIPLFEVQELGMAQAAGLLLAVRFAIVKTSIHDPKKNKDNTHSDDWKQFIFYVLMSLSFWGIGAIVSLFI